MQIERLSRNASLPRHARGGAAALDQVLLLGALFSLGGIALLLGTRLIDLVYEYVVAWISWPF